MKQKENAPIKVAVVGLGRAGWDIHVKRMRGDDRFHITAVCDLNEARMEEARAEFGCATFKSFDELLKGADCDLVVIASQSIDHGPQSIAALNSGEDHVAALTELILRNGQGWPEFDPAWDGARIAAQRTAARVRAERMRDAR